MLAEEIERANSEYINKLNDIDVALKQAPKSNQKYERVLTINKDEETE